MPLNRLTAGPALVPSKQPQAARQPGEATARFRAAVRHQGTGNSSSRHRYACASAWRIHKTVNLPCVRACGVGTFTDIVRYLDVDGWRDRLPPGPYWECGKTGDPDTGDRQAARFGNCRRRTSPSHAGRWMEGALVSTSSRTRSHHSVRFAGLGAGSRRSNVRMRYTIEMYTPQQKRIYGYYVCPFLLGDTLVARLDLKADRERRMLRVQSAFLEPHRSARAIVSDVAEEFGLLRLGSSSMPSKSKTQRNREAERPVAGELDPISRARLEPRLWRLSVN